VNDFEKKVAELREIFLQGLEKRFMDMERALSLLEEDPADASALEALCAQLHKLGGAAGPYGYPEASELALDADEMCVGLIEDGKSPTPGQVGKLAETVAALRKSFSTKS